MSLYTYEHILASHYGWALDAIRSLDLQDFYAHLRICMERESVQNELKAILAGASEPEESHETSQPRVISSKRLPSGATLETTKEKTMKFNSRVKPVRINKEGQYVGDM